MDGLFLNGDTEYPPDKQENLDALAVPPDTSDPLIPHGGGRRPAAEWNEFTEDSLGQLLCKHCKASVSAKVERLRLHLEKCPEYNGVKQENGDCPPAKKKPREDSDSCSSNSDEDFTDEEGDDEATGEDKKEEKAVNAEIDEAIARFFYEANVPPIKAENMFFRSMIYKLRPNYSAPDRYQLEQRLLKFRQTKK